MCTENKSWVETFREVMSRELPPRNTDFNVAFFVKPPSENEVNELLKELDNLEKEIAKK